MVHENNANAVITLEVEAGGSDGYYDQNDGTLSRWDGWQCWSTERVCIICMIISAVLFGICLIILIYHLAIFGGRFFRGSNWAFYVIDLFSPLFFGLIFGVSFRQLCKH
jgi:hypothetical protein